MFVYKLVTYAWLESGLKATEVGCKPTEIVAVTVLLAVLMAVTWDEFRSATYSRAPFGLTVMAPGAVPTAIVAIMDLLERLTTDTLSYVADAT
jgi:hypothetical protein